MGLAEILTGLLAILVAVVPPLVTMLSKRAAERKKMGDGLQQVESDEADVARARSMLFIAACSHQPTRSNQWFCPPTPAYHSDGSLDTTRYSVDRECWISSDAKLKACYLEAKP